MPSDNDAVILEPAEDEPNYLEKRIALQQVANAESVSKINSDV